MAAWHDHLAWRRVAFAAGVLLLVALLGCGKNRILLDVDVRSFMDPDQLVNRYDAPPLVPVQLQLGAIPVNLVEGFEDFGAAESATMDIGVVYANVSGQGRARFKIYFDADPATIFGNAPVATLEVELQPGQTTSSRVRIDADPRVLALFTSKHFYMGVDLAWEPQDGASLSGTCTIEEIQVHVVSTLDLFG